MNRQAAEQVETRIAETVIANLEAESRSAGAYWTIAREWHRVTARYHAFRQQALIETRDKLDSEARERLISDPDGYT